MTETLSLWRHPDFRKLWAAQTISQIGSQITFLALPLTAVLVLGATPAQMGLLTALEGLPALLVGLHAGAVVDRRRRRPILIGSDLGRALLVALVPLAWLVGVLTIEILFVVAILIALLALFFDVAYQAYLPSILDRERLLDGNGKLELSRTAAEVVGPGLGGGLVQLLQAPLALAADAASFLVSALLLTRIWVREALPEREERTSVWREIVAGLRVVAGDDRLRAIAGARGLLGFFNAGLEAVFVLFIATSLGLAPALVGLVFAVGSVGFVVGALLPERMTRRFGFGPATAGAVLLVGFSDLLVPLADDSPWVAVPLLAAAQFCFGIGLTLFNVNQASLRQAVVPARLQGRASATLRVLASGLIPVGAILGGLLGGWLGLRETLVLAAAGELLAALWLWRSPLRHLRELPANGATV